MRLTKAEFWTWTAQESEGGLVGNGRATRSQLRKLKVGESFIDSTGKRWWKYAIDWDNRRYFCLNMQKNKFIYVDRSISEMSDPQPTDAVLGGRESQPRPYDAVLGGKL